MGYTAVMVELKEALADVQDWEVVCRFLPPGWEEAARSTGAFSRARGVNNPEDMLRVLLIHLASGCSLKETAARAQTTGLAAMNHSAVGKRLRSSQEWLRWLAQETRAEDSMSLPSLNRRLIAVDASVISEPGSTGTDYRVHYAVNLADLQCRFFELTDARVGETFRLFPVQPGDVMMGDRLYANPPGVAHVVESGGDVLVRLNRLALPLYNDKKQRFDLLKGARKSRVGTPVEFEVSVRHPKKEALIPGRLIVIRRTREATRLARKMLKRKASRKQHPLTRDTLRAAAYFFVFTTLPTEITPEKILEYYRYRWQIELVFKRLKSIMNLGHLPKHNKESAFAWIHGKIFIGFLVNRILAEAGSFSPWGYSLESTKKPLA